MTSLKINPLFKNALRPLDADEYDRLSASIEVEGCREPIETWSGYIIAGHNRYQICNETGQSFQTKNRDDDFENETDVLIWILDDALARRNLDFSDKKKYIGELYNLTKQQDSERSERLADNYVPQGRVSENIGEKFGVSERTVRRYGSEAEKQKILETLKNDIWKLAVREGKTEDEDWQQERFNEATESLQSDDESESFDGHSTDDDYNQAEPTEEQRAAHKAKNPKRPGPKPKKVEQMQREALNGYATALDKIQSCGVTVLCPDIVLPDFKPLYASIEVEREKLPKPKKRFGR